MQPFVISVWGMILITGIAFSLGSVIGVIYGYMQCAKDKSNE